VEVGPDAKTLAHGPGDERGERGCACDFGGGDKTEVRPWPKTATENTTLRSAVPAATRCIARKPWNSHWLNSGTKNTTRP
jgi:hypothetical protein